MKRLYWLAGVMGIVGSSFCSASQGSASPLPRQFQKRAEVSVVLFEDCAGLSSSLKEEIKDTKELRLQDLKDKSLFAPLHKLRVEGIANCQPFQLQKETEYGLFGVKQPSSYNSIELNFTLKVHHRTGEKTEDSHMLTVFGDPSYCPIEDLRQELITEVVQLLRKAARSPKTQD